MDYLTALLPWMMLMVQAYLFTKLAFRQMKVIEDLSARQQPPYNVFTPTPMEYPGPDPVESDIQDAFDELG